MKINARLTASSAFYTRLELGKDKIPLMAYHVGSFLNLDMPFNKQPEPDIQGSQIILKNKNYNLKLKQNTSFAHPVIPSAAKRSRGIFPLTKRRRSLHSSTIVESVGMTTAKLVQNPGVYKIDAENKVRWQRSGYSPEKLSQDEFIYFKKDVRSNDDNELTRIETKEEVLDKPHKLSFWIDNILQ